MVKTVHYNASAQEIKQELQEKGTKLVSCEVCGFQDITQQGDCWPHYYWTEEHPEFYAIIGIYEDNREVIAEYDKEEDALKVMEELKIK